MWYCSECGKKNNGKFCTRCGTKYVEIEDDSPVSGGEYVSAASAGKDETAAADRFGASSSEETADGIFNASALCRVREEPPRSAPAKKEAEPSLVPEKEPYLPEETGNDGDNERDTLLFPAESPEVPLETMTEPEIGVGASVPENVGKWEPETENFWVPPYLREEETFCEPENNGTGFLRGKRNEPGEEKFSRNEEEHPSPAEESSVSGGETETSPETRWVAPYLREEESLPAEETSGGDFLRGERKEPAPDEEGAEETLSVDSVFTHRLPPQNEEDREWRYSKRVLISVGAVGGVVFLALMILLGSLFVNLHPNEEALPESSGVYAYVSGVKDTTPLYADKSIKSDVLAELKNGDTVEYLEKINREFVYVLDPETEQYGYVRSAYLVKDKNDVDYGNVENQYDNEKSLGHFYVTKVKDYLTLWENPDGGGMVKAKMECGDKVSLLEKTNDSYWYVFDYTSAERGYVRCSYLTDSKSKVVYPFKEPKDKTVIGEYYVTGVKNYLPIYSRPNTGGDVRGKLNNGDKVGLIEKTNSSFWYVSGNGVYGWVSASYLTATPPTPEPEPEPTPTPEPAPTPTPAPDTSNQYKVTGTQEYLPLLNAAATDSGEVARLHNGDTVKVLDSSGDTFWYIEVPSTGVKGYVVKDYLMK